MRTPASDIDILKQARALILRGFATRTSCSRLDGINIAGSFARTRNGRPCSPLSPAATRWSLEGAIERAVCQAYRHEDHDCRIAIALDFRLLTGSGHTTQDHALAAIARAIVAIHR